MTYTRTKAWDDHYTCTKYICMSDLTWLPESSGEFTDCPLPDCLPDFNKVEACLASSSLVEWSVHDLALGLMGIVALHGGGSY